MNKSTRVLSLLTAVFFSSTVFAQQLVPVIKPCGGTEMVTIPNIIDRDSDGMDDRLEQKLLDRFVPVIMMFSSETCPGPALNGTGDSNLLACRITPYPGQYLLADSIDSLKTFPLPLASDTGLKTGMVWYNPFVMVHCAILYGQDCGLLGHSADVEGFHFSLRYIGPDSVSGWRYDTLMQNWMGVSIQSIGHDATICQHIETLPYKSALFPNGADTIYASPEKHANYLTIPGCDGANPCNPNCDSPQIRKYVINVNLGEPWAPLVTDLGTYYSAYAGQNPWGTTNFLSGGAGTIAAKMERPLSSNFAQGTVLNSVDQICSLYKQCYPCGDSIYNYCVLSGTGISTGTPGFTPWYHCGETFVLSINQPGVDRSPNIFPIPADRLLQCSYPDDLNLLSAVIYNAQGTEVKKLSLQGHVESIDVSNLAHGYYTIQFRSAQNVFTKKLVIE